MPTTVLDSKRSRFLANAANRPSHDNVEISNVAYSVGRSENAWQEMRIRSDFAEYILRYRYAIWRDPKVQ
jgi:hypothetical protein